MKGASNYPDTTYAGDPSAPWNQEDPKRLCESCANWNQCPQEGAKPSSLGWCAYHHEFTQEDEEDECVEWEPI